MEITGRIKQINETKSYGDKGFQKRELIVTTNEQYPQPLLIEFVQDKCSILDNYKSGQDVKIGINLRGREWVNDKNETKYFNSVQGWKIELSDDQGSPAAQEPQTEDDLPF